MSQTRTDRRAAERRAAKLARKAAQKPNPAIANTPIALSEPTPVITLTLCPDDDSSMDESTTASEPKPAISEAKLTANRANAQKSTGPRTDAAKAKTRYNAVRPSICSKPTSRSPTKNTFAIYTCSKTASPATEPKI